MTDIRRMPPWTTATIAGIDDFLKGGHILTKSGSPWSSQGTARHDALKARFAGFGERDRALGGQRFAE
jgi:hypothetical protein